MKKVINSKLFSFIVLVIVPLMIIGLLFIFNSCDVSEENNNKNTIKNEDCPDVLTEEILTEEIITEKIIHEESKMEKLIREKDLAFKKGDYAEVERLTNEIIKLQDKNFCTIRVITSSERELLARLVSCEASICSTECKRDVVSVVFNRLDSGHWGDSIYEVVYYKNAFTPATSGKIETEQPDQSCYDAVDYVLSYGVTVPTQVRYFRTDYDFKWEGYKNYKVIDNTYFGYFENWKNGEW